MAKSTTVADYADFLTSLDNEGKAYFMEGGQAVNLWAEYYSNASNKKEQLSEFLPFTSKDCDIWVNHETIKHIEQNSPSGSFVKGSSPADGQIAVYTIQGNPTLEVDLMGGVYGIPAKKNEHLYARSLNFDGLRVLDPLYLFQSKCSCLTGLPQSDRQDRKHLFILLAILPEYFCELHAQATQKTITERQLINELKLLLKICGLRQVKEALQNVKNQPADLFPLELLKTSELPKVHQFTQDTLLRKLA